MHLFSVVLGHLQHVLAHNQQKDEEKITKSTNSIYLKNYSHLTTKGLLLLRYIAKGFSYNLYIRQNMHFFPYEQKILLKMCESIQRSAIIKNKHVELASFEIAQEFCKKNDVALLQRMSFVQCMQWDFVHKWFPLHMDLPESIYSTKAPQRLLFKYQRRIFHCVNICDIAPSCSCYVSQANALSALTLYSHSLQGLWYKLRCQIDADYSLPATESGTAGLEFVAFISAEPIDSRDHLSYI